MADDPNNNRGRFQKGVSGNKNGRPKGAINRKTALESELGTTIPVTENGKRKNISKWEAFIKQLVNKAIAGDLRAAEILLKYVSKYGGWMMGAGLTASPAVDGLGAQPQENLPQVTITDNIPLSKDELWDRIKQLETSVPNQEGDGETRAILPPGDDGSQKKINEPR